MPNAYRWGAGTGFAAGAALIALAEHNFIAAIGFSAATVWMVICDRRRGLRLTPFWLSDKTELKAMTTYQQYGIVPCAYRVPVERFIQIVERDENAWAIFDGACCLNSDSEWEVEPQPSSRTDSFKMRTRWPLAEAMERAVRHFHLGFAANL